MRQAGETYRCCHPIHYRGQHELFRIIQTRDTWALALALDNAGNNIAANIAIIAITTSNSIQREGMGRAVTFATDAAANFQFLIV